MFRPNAVTSIAAGLCLLGGSCQALTGSVDVVTPPDGRAPMPDPVVIETGGTPVPETDARQPPAPSAGVIEVPGAGAPLLPAMPPLNDAAGAVSDAGVPGEPDAAPPPPPPPPALRPVLVASAASDLERVGEEGGEPHLGVCEGGVVIGIRPTANPSEETFGQRVTFVEPLCGTLILEPSSDGDLASSRVSVAPDDAILMWEESDEFQGPPVTEVPDPRLVWVPQPPTVCPEATPVLVGLAGEYDPAAPDSTGTSAIRSVVIECAPLAVAPDGIEVRASALGHQLVARGDSFAADGAAEYASSCADGAVTTRMVLHAGFWLDGFVLGCSSLASPHLAGEPCADAGECQSGVCGADATCQP